MYVCIYIYICTYIAVALLAQGWLKVARPSLSASIRPAPRHHSLLVLPALPALLLLLLLLLLPLCHGVRGTSCQVGGKPGSQKSTGRGTCSSSRPPVLILRPDTPKGVGIALMNSRFGGRLIATMLRSAVWLCASCIGEKQNQKNRKNNNYIYIYRVRPVPS